MRIIVKAKPIRIRIKSGGEEHSSLDSLRQNLCVQDLWPLVKDKRLSRWLMQLGEVDLAHAIDALTDSNLTFEVCFKLLSIFLSNDIEQNSVRNIYELYEYWHRTDDKDTKNCQNLRTYLLKSLNGVKYLYQSFPDDFSKELWLKCFGKYEDSQDPQMLFWEGNMLYVSKKYKDVQYGLELIQKAAQLGSSEAASFVKSGKYDLARKQAMLTSEVKEKIECQIDRWKIERQGYSNKIIDTDEDIVKEVKLLLREFTSFLKVYKTESLGSGAVENVIIDKYVNTDSSNVFYRERSFLLDLATYSRNSDKANCVQILGLFVEQQDKYNYPLAQYMLHRPTDNRIDGFAFAATSFPNQLRFIVDHLFTY